MKKILIKGPVLSQSGYGEQARFALRSMRTMESAGQCEIYIIPTAWGQTSWINGVTEERTYIDQAIAKTHVYTQQGGQFDASIQVGIPNEWQRLAPINIGYTAGIETTKVSPLWLQKANEMDKIIVVSEHSRDVFKNTMYQGRHPETNLVTSLSTNTPISVVNYPVKNPGKKTIKLDLHYKFNYLAVACLLYTSDAADE